MEKYLGEIALAAAAGLVGILATVATGFKAAIGAYFRYKEGQFLGYAKAQKVRLSEAKFWAATQSHLAVGIDAAIASAKVHNDKKERLVAVHQKTYWLLFAEMIHALCARENFDTMPDLEAHFYNAYTEFRKKFRQTLLTGTPAYPEKALAVLDEAMIPYSRAKLDMLDVIFSSARFDSNAERMFFFLEYVTYHQREMSANMIIRLLAANGEIDILAY